MLTSKLKLFQEETVKWMKEREQSTTGGGFLFHEQGLGKTICSIALMVECDYRNNLIVCPSGLIPMWKQQILQHTDLDESEIELYYGPNRNRFNSNSNSKIYITSYNIVSIEYKKLLEGRCAAARSHFLNHIFHRIVFDEIHHIRNRKTKSSVACTNLLQAKHFWLLTGTPTFNHIDDLYPYFKILGIEGVDSFIGFRALLSHKLTMRDIRKANEFIYNYGLRFTKEEVLNELLPPLENVIEMLEFSEIEIKFYDALYMYSRKRIGRLMNRIEQLDNSEMNKVLKRMMNICVLTLILRLKQACDSPHLIIYSMKRLEAKNIEQATTELDFVNKSRNNSMECPLCLDKIAEYMFIPCGHKVCATCNELLLKHKFDKCFMCKCKIEDMTHQSVVSTKFSEITVDELCKSTKIKRLLEILESLLSQDKKVVIVSQWTSMIYLLQKVFKEKFNETSLILSGKVPIQDRQEIVEEFQTKSKYKILILSLNSSAEGITLTAASTLIHIDLWWNKSKEEQVNARIHRIGQMNQVKIMYLRIKDTIEEPIANLIEKKGTMSDLILTKNEIRRVRMDNSGWLEKIITLLDSTKI